MSRNRGSGKKSINTLTRKHATSEETLAVIRSSQVRLSPIACAILLASMVEQVLESLLRQRIPRNDDETWEKLTTPGSALDSFSRKIDLGYAFRLFDAEFKQNLETLKSIRNGFAHAKMLIDFDNEAIVEQLKNTTFPQEKFKKRTILVKDIRKLASSSPREGFLALVALAFTQLTGHQMRGMRISESRRKLTPNKARALLLSEQFRSLPKGTRIAAMFQIEPEQTYAGDHSPAATSPAHEGNRGTPPLSSPGGDDNKGK